MKPLTRRSVLKGLTKTSILVAAAPLIPAIVGCETSDRSIFLNVALHGLFVLNITDTHIELLTPKVKDHIYRAGTWDADKIFLLDPGAQYELKGVDGQKDMPYFDSSVTPVLSQSEDKFTVCHEASRCCVILPFPAELHFLRSISVDHPYLPQDAEKWPCDSKGQKKDIDITKVSLCQVLRYRVSDWSELRLSDKWNPGAEDVDCKTHTVNLHFWAEPEQRLTPTHADEAYKRLSCLLPPLNLRLRVYSTPPLDRYTGICGFPPEQEQGWSDWESGGAEGTHPTNCCAVMVTQ